MMTAGLLNAVKSEAPAHVLDWLGAWVDDLERVLSVQTSSPVETIEAVGTSTLSAGGKRLRPALCAISAMATGRPFDRDRTTRLGACLEMVHMATLVHDDVIDESQTRRGRPTAASLYGNTAAILGGDVLLARAMRLLAVDGDVRIIRAVSESVVDLAEGEVWELEVRGQLELDESVHFQVLDRKTASLIACSCRVGAMAADAPEGVVDCLSSYGRHLGLAFQIADDILDFCGDHHKTGKPRGTDFRDGQATLPLIDLLQSSTPDEVLFLRSRFGNGATDTDLETIVRWMGERGSLDRAKGRASHEAEAAVAALAGLPDSPYRQLLASVAGFAADREA